MSSENTHAKRHYTPQEREIFLDALSKQRHIIENRESDNFRAKQKLAAWARVASEYNSSPSITRERSVIQLKTLWANLKQGQRWNLTKEKQSCLAAGGGPAEPPAVIDSAIAAIAPHLMMTIPMGGSSNIKPVSQNDMNDQIPMEPIPCTEIRMDTASSQVMQSPPSKIARLSSGGWSMGTNSSHGGDYEKELREERVRRLMAHDDELAGIRRMQELELWEMKKKHVDEICNLEIRAAQAKAELAELELQLAISR